MTLSQDRVLANTAAQKKSKKRKMTDDAEESDPKFAKISDDDSISSEPRRVPLPGTKKRGFSWTVYLENEKAVAAPTKLFKDVSVFNILSFDD